MKLWPANRRLVFVLVASALGSTPFAWSAEVPTSVAVVSLIGDAVRVVGQESVTGTRINRNPKDDLQITFDTIELISLRVATQAVLANDANVKAAPLKITDPVVYASQGGITGDVAQLPAAILEPLRAAKITHLLLITRFRDDARMKMARGSLGSGKVEGVGYYLDTETKMNLTSDGTMSSRGYLAPYVYVRASLIDLANLKVIRTSTSAVGTVIIASQTGTRGDPWDVLDTGQKIVKLQEMVSTQIKDVVTRTMSAN